MKRLLLICCFMLPACLSIAKVTLPALISSHMVLQQKSRVKLWGHGKPFAQVSIRPSWSNKDYLTESDSTGNWQISVKTAPAGGPYNISFNDGDGEVMVNDVFLGEVWVCSGQSNMVMPLKGYDKGQNVYGSDSVIDAADQYNTIRVFDVPKVILAIPKDDTGSSWKISTTANAPGFSAIAYQFATLLNNKLHVPIGIITTCWGSTAIQSWMSEDNLRQFPEVTISNRIDTMKIPAANPETLTAALFNGMVLPISQYRIKGFLWYQGESNKNATLYSKLFPAMVREWRQMWGDEKLPFYYVQIAPWNYQDRNTAFLREAQLQAKISFSGMAVALDAGQQNRIHPPDKLLIAKRLYYLALNQTYGQNHIPCKSPELKKVSYNASNVILTFKNVYKGLKARNGQAINFEVAGADHVFYPAKATIAGKDKIVLNCDEVRQPAAVRYAFKNWVKGDLFNSEGLPASSFRTDNYKL